MTDSMTYKFNEFANDVVQYHSYFASLISGIIIGMITNYLITYFLPINSIIGIIINVVLLIISSYVAMLYSPDIVRKGVTCDIPESLSIFITQHFTNFLVYIRNDLEYFAFKDDYPSFSNFNIKENVAIEGTKEEYRLPWQMVITYTFLKVFKCKIYLKVTAFAHRGKGSMQVDLELNKYARFHPKTDKILKTVGARISLAINNPRLFYREISDGEYKIIMDDLRNHQ